METIFEAPPCEHFAVRVPVRTAHPTTITHDRTERDDYSDALYAVFGGDINPNHPSVPQELRMALRGALEERGVSSVSIDRLVPIDVSTAVEEEYA